MVQHFGKSCIPVSTSFLLICLITWVTASDASWMVWKCFPQSSFLSLGNKSKSDGFRSYLLVWQYAVMKINMQNMHFRFEYVRPSLAAKHLVEIFCSIILLQWLVPWEHSTCYYSILVIRYSHQQLDFGLLTIAIFGLGVSWYFHCKHWDLKSGSKSLIHVMIKAIIWF